MTDKPILVTGATGYVGGRLIPRLAAAGYRVRAMGRSLDKMACRPWAAHDRVELVQADVLDAESLRPAVAGCATIYYLVHSMIASKAAYARADRQGAENMVAATRNADVDHMIYLGGLGEIDHPNVSKHLLSRHEVGQILQAGSVPVTILRAAMILGSGSASFEILRYLVERLPVMVTPRWVDIPTQPIAITNILGYLQGCMAHPETRGQTFDIGGPEQVSYRDLIHMFANEAGLPRRRIIPAPVLTPTLSAKWIHLITPVPASIAQPLTEGLSLPTVCTENRIRRMIPQDLLTCRQAIGTALQRMRQQQIDTCWMDAGKLIPPEWAFCGDAGYAGGTILECGYRATIQAPAWDVWRPVQHLGGRQGYYHGNWLWRLRGMLDRLAGGVGLGRGRRHAHTLAVGDALDFWRVLRIEPPESLLLLAEMKMPGEALLDIRVQSLGKDRCMLSMLSRFLPSGVAGLAYWYALYPFHQYIFRGMLSAIAQAAGGPVIDGPRRFTPKLASTCRLPQ